MMLSSALVLAMSAALPQVRREPNADWVIPPPSRSPLLHPHPSWLRGKAGPHPCACGRIISGNKNRCLACVKAAA